MDFAHYVEYLEEELVNTYSMFYSRLCDGYVIKYYSELLNFKKSSEFKKLKSKAYWSRPKEQIDLEALAEELSKLDYWLPGGRLNNTHISYADIEEISDAQANRERSLLEATFKPSVSIQDYFKRESVKLKSGISDILLLSFIDSLSKCTDHWKSPDSFDYYCLDNSTQLDLGLSAFLSDLKVLLKHYESRFSTISQIHKSQSQVRAKIVTNGSRIIVNLSSTTKPSVFQIDIVKYPQHEGILGLKEGDVFTLPGISSAYRIIEIWR